MGLLTMLFGGNNSNPIKDIGNTLDKVFTSDEERLSKQALIKRISQQPQLAQLALNKATVQHKSIFVAGGYAFILWVCGLSIASFFLPQFVFGAYLWIKMCVKKNELLPYPVNGKYLMEVVLTVLGCGGLAVIERFKKIK